MKTALAIVTLSTLLSACASLTPTAAPTPALAGAPSSTLATSASSDDAPGKPDDDTTAAQQAAEGLPSVALTDELMFKLLAGEIAFQRGGWQAGYVNMLSAAQQTSDPRLARRAAEMAIAAKQPAEALAAIRLWRTLAPKSDEATQYYLGMILMGDDLSEVQEVFEQRLRDVRPASRGILLLQVQRLLLRAKDKSAAFAVLERLAAPYTAISETHVALAQGAFANNDSVRARSEAEQALTLRPDSEIAALTLAQVIVDRKEAVQRLGQFVTTNPSSHEARVAYGRMLIEQMQYEQARVQFETLLKSHPDDPTTLFALGILGTQTKDYKSAEKYLGAYLKVLADHPDESRDPGQALMILAQMAEERKDIPGALKYLADVPPGEAFLGAQIKRAQLVAQAGEVAAARRQLHDITVEGEREQSLIVQAEAQILREANLPQEAYQVLTQGIQRFPDNTDILYDFAMSAEKADQLDKMEVALRRVMQLAPTNQHAYNALGYSLAERNIRLPEAETLVEQALKLAPDDAFILDSMGWVQFRLGKLPESEALLRRAYKLRPDAEIAVHLGEVLWVRGQKDDAQKFWRDARTKDPKNDSLKSTLARLQVRL